MSRQTMEQKRAAHAWRRVGEVKCEGKHAKEYGSLARSAPADIQTNGLGQALAFWYAKGKPEKGSKAHLYLYEHVADWLADAGVSDSRDLLTWITEHNSDAYRRATREALAYLTWVKRFAEAELPHE